MILTLQWRDTALTMLCYEPDTSLLSFCDGGGWAGSGATCAASSGAGVGGDKHAWGLRRVGVWRRWAFGEQSTVPTTAMHTNRKLL